MAGRRNSEGTARNEGATDSKDDTHRHGRGENSCHARDDGADGIVRARRGDDKPEEHVDHIHDPNRAVEVETIAEHELPVGELLHLERSQGALNCQVELDRCVGRISMSG